MIFPKIKLHLVSILFLGFLTACVANPATNLPLVDSPPLTSYELGSGDTIRVVVFGHQDVPTEYMLDGTGEISIPLAERVVATGLTTQELEREIAKALKDVLVNAKVNVQVLAFRPVFVLGGVNTPGQFPYSRNMTVLSAIALARGFTKGAFDQEVKITRLAKDGSTKEWRAEINTHVYPDDVIFIYERF